MFPSMRLQRAQRRVNSHIFGGKAGSIQYPGGRRDRRFFPCQPVRYQLRSAPVNSCAASPRKQVEFRRFEVVDMLRITCVDEKGARAH
jgi:hypothetical protein